MVNINIEIDSELHKKAKKKALDEDITLARYVENAIKEKVK